MGLLSTVGSLAGAYFGGPVGSAIGGSLGGFVEGEYKQNKANDFNSAQAAASRQWSTDMSGTTYQRTMADMKAAGLNPMLAYSQGGSSVPIGATAQYPGAVGAQYETSSAATQQANTAASIGNSTVEKIKAEITNLSSTNDQIKAITQNLTQEYQNLVKEGYNKTETGNLLRAQVDKLVAEVPQIQSETFLNAAREYLTRVQAELSNLDLKAGQDMNNLGRTANQVAPILQLLINAIRVSK